VIEFESKHMPALRAQLQNEFGVEVQTACLCLTGLCEQCRKQVLTLQTADGRQARASRERSPCGPA
jgi:hypothetical protein